MRALVVLALALCAADCAKPQAASSGQGCAQQVERRIAFTGAEAADRIEARSFGSDCANAVVVMTLRKPDGAPLWVYAATYEAMGRGGGDASAMHGFLERWSGAMVDDTSASPEWKPDEAAPQGWGPSGSSPFPRETYETIRAARHPRLCVPTSASSISCLFYEPTSETVDVHFKGED